MAAAAVALTDEHLAVLAHRGSRRAFTQLYERHHAPLYRYCLGILRQHHDAQDAVQATMTRALVALEGREPPAAARAWLYSIAHNESVDQLRRRRRHTELTDAEHLPSPSVERGLEQRERLGLTLRDLRQLPERQRSALVLRELAGLSDDEIGAALGIAPSGVRQAVFEARTTLHDFAAGRDLSCAVVERTIAEGDARRLRARPVRAHLRACTSCSAARARMRGPRVRFAGFVPLPLWATDLLARVPGAGPEPTALAAKTVLAALAATSIGLSAAQHGLPQLAGLRALADRPPLNAIAPPTAERTPAPAVVAPYLARVELAPGAVPHPATYALTPLPLRVTVQHPRSPLAPRHGRPVVAGELPKLSASPPSAPAAPQAPATSVEPSAAPETVAPAPSPAGAAPPAAQPEPKAPTAVKAEPAAAPPAPLRPAPADPAPIDPAPPTAPEPAPAVTEPPAPQTTSPGLDGALNPGDGAAPPGQGGVPPGQAKKAPTSGADATLETPPADPAPVDPAPPAAPDPAPAATAPPGHGGVPRGQAKKLAK